MLIKDIGALLESHGFGTVGTDIFLDQLLDAPDNQIGIFSTPSRPQMLKIKELYYNFQIRIRNKSYESGYTKAIEIYNILDDGEIRSHHTVAGRNIIIRALQPPYMMMRDDMQRVHFVFNIQVLTNRD